MFRRPLPPGTQAFTAWAMLGALIVYGHESILASTLVIYVGAAFVLIGLVRDTSQWRDALGSGAGAGMLLAGLGALNVGYEACVPPPTQASICAGFPPEPHLLAGVALVAVSLGLWMLFRRNRFGARQA